MTSHTYYDVTQWPVGDPYKDIGLVINSMIKDIKRNQSQIDLDEGGKPGATIFIPPGDYHLETQVLIDISYLSIVGSGHGFTSSSIRFNLSQANEQSLHELWPGGSRILVNLKPRKDDETSSAAFLIKRDGSPRISSVEFSHFCIDGLHFVDDGSSEKNPENTYINGKTGIYVACAQDSFRINGMGLVYLEHGIIIKQADALSIHDNFIAECGNCIELRDWGQASKITDNLIGAGYKGYSIFAEHFGGLLISSNNIFPRGASSIYFKNVVRSTITSNRLHSFYPGMIDLRDDSSDNLVAANHIYRAHEPWPPMQDHDNGLNDLYGIVRIDGNNNSLIANHFSDILDSTSINPIGTTPVIIHLINGSGNYIASNHIVATTETEDSLEEEEKDNSDSCFSTQVTAMLSGEAARSINFLAVQVDPPSSHNMILDTGTSSQIRMDKTSNACRPLPEQPV